MSIAKAPLTLPAELIDHTIDYLADDLECLRACTSVSWTFLRSARQHLFRKVAVNAPSEHAGQGYTPFLDFLTRTPEVCAYIHHVKFAELHSQPFPECQQYPSLCSHFLGQMLSHLPHLRTLMFEEGTYFPCQCPKDLPNTTSQPPSTNTRLHSLSLRSVRIGTRQDLSSLLRHFAEVHTLEVSDLRVQRSWDGHEGEEGRHAGEERCVEVRSLALNIAHVHDAVASKALSAALGDVLNFAALREVSFGFNHAQHIEPFGNLVSRSAKHLESLTVRLPAHPCMQIPSEEWRHLQLSSFQNLKSLAFVEDYTIKPKDTPRVSVFSGEANRTVCVSIKDMLHNIPTSLELLTFCFKLRVFGTGSAGQLIDNFGWEELQGMTSRCEGMRGVKFVFQGRPKGDRFLKAAVLGRLSRLQAQGLLDIAFEE